MVFKCHYTLFDLPNVSLVREEVTAWFKSTGVEGGVELIATRDPELCQLQFNGSLQGRQNVTFSRPFARKLLAGPDGDGRLKAEITTFLASLQRNGEVRSGQAETESQHS